MTTLIAKDEGLLPTFAATALWVALIAALCVGGSFAYACAAPLAAISALAAIKMGRSDGVVLVTIAWLANQAVGYGLLDYPQTANSFAWGGAIGVAAIAGFYATRSVLVIGLPRIATLCAALVAAFAAYEIILYATGLVLGSSVSAYSPAVVGRIFAINAVSFLGLLLLHRIAVAIALLRPVEDGTPASV